MQVHMTKMLPIAARTATTSSDEYENTWERGILIIVNGTVWASDPLPQVTPKIQAYDPIAKEYFDYWIAAAALTAVGRATYLIHPTVLAGAVGSITEGVKLPLPAKWKLVMTHGSAEAVTYSVSAHKFV